VSYSHPDIDPCHVKEVRQLMFCTFDNDRQKYADVKRLYE